MWMKCSQKESKMIELYISKRERNYFCILNSIVVTQVPLYGWSTSVFSVTANWSPGKTVMDSTGEFFIFADPSGFNPKISVKTTCEWRCDKYVMNLSASSLTVYTRSLSSLAGKNSRCTKFSTVDPSIQRWASDPWLHLIYPQMTT